MVSSQDRKEVESWVRMNSQDQERGSVTGHGEFSGSGKRLSHGSRLVLRIRKEVESWVKMSSQDL